MDWNDERICPHLMDGPRLVLQYEFTLGTSELSAMDNGKWAVDQGARYSACLHENCLHIWDGHLDACIYDLRLERLPAGLAKVDRVHVLDDPDCYLRCAEDREELVRLTRILQCLFPARG